MKPSQRPVLILASVALLFAVLQLWHARVEDELLGLWLPNPFPSGELPPHASLGNDELDVVIRDETLTYKAGPTTGRKSLEALLEDYGLDRGYLQMIADHNGLPEAADVPETALEIQLEGRRQRPSGAP